MRPWPALFLLASSLAQAYLPLEAGRAWVYSDGTVQEVVGRKGEVAVLEYRKEAPLRRDRLLLKDGVWLLGVELPRGVFAYEPPLLLYPARLEVGASWSSRGTFQGQKVALSGRVEGVEGVEVPLGRFNAYRLRLAYTTEKGGASLLELYLVPGLGVVRYLSGGRAVDLVRRLP
ncbi:hypothetical protein [Thermus filiformis]|uniref:Uncharacterized protein n=1 Tax=Thermus filiformis TaxID=276 RepID=A0A0D6X9V9_THEFI|nr:hypothetical protein [Thermus filiformis]KIX84525.1 hypothetical protein THFILI_07235 [Thermus filiformis]